MDTYLVALSVGPVQDFIAAARRTRDLWFGSHVLSEISKSAANAVFSEYGKEALIFPAAENPSEDLQPCAAGKAQDCFCVGNKVLFLIDTNSPEDITVRIKKAASDRWLEIADSAKDKAKAAEIEIDEEIWNKQINDTLEMFVAWLSYDKNKEHKPQQARLDSLLSARKNTREFIQNTLSGKGIQKSSLDGLRESVIKHAPKEWQARRAGINPTEALDCIGIIKRMALDPEQFTPVSRISIDPWIRGIGDKIDWSNYEAVFKSLIKEGIGSHVSGNDKTYQTLPFDGQLLYPSRLEAELAKNTNNVEITKLLEQIQTSLHNNKVYKEHK